MLDKDQITKIKSHHEAKIRGSFFVIGIKPTLAMCKEYADDKAKKADGENKEHWLMVSKTLAKLISEL